MSHSTLSVLSGQVRWSNGSLCWRIRTTAIQLHWTFNHDFLANVPVEKGKRFSGLDNFSFFSFNSSFTSMCWQLSAPPFHNGTRDTCELESSDLEQRKRNHCLMEEKLRLMFKGFKLVQLKCHQWQKYDPERPLPLLTALCEQSGKKIEKFMRIFLAKVFQIIMKLIFPNVISSLTFHCLVQHPKRESCELAAYSKQSDFLGQSASKLLRLNPKTSLCPEKRSDWLASGGFLINLQTHITPSTDNIEQVILAERQVEDALIYSFWWTFWGEIFLGNFHPAQRSHCEPNRLISIRFQWITAAPVEMEKWYFIISHEPPRDYALLTCIPNLFASCSLGRDLSYDWTYFVQQLDFQLLCYYRWSCFRSKCFHLSPRGSCRMSWMQQSKDCWFHHRQELDFMQGFVNADSLYFTRSLKSLPGWGH